MNKITVSLLVLVCLQACSLNKKADNEVVIDVDDEFQLRYVENLMTPEDDLIFFLESIRNRECERDTVVMEIATFSSAVRLDIDVVNATNNCLPGTQPSTTEAATANMENSLTALSIHLEGLVDNQGQILKDDQTYSIKMETSYGFYLPYETMRRVPESSIWGYVGFTPNFSSIAQDLIDELYNLSDDINLEEGQYGYFTADKNGDIRIEGLNELAMYTRPFIRSYKPGNLIAVRALFEKYKEQYPGMKLVFYDSFGNVFE
jgi:hypothetical protein